MSEKKFLKGSEEWMMFMDFWNLCQKFWIPENSDEYFEKFAKSQEIFTKRYKHSPFSIALALALADEIDRKSEELKE